MLNLCGMLIPNLCSAICVKETGGQELNFQTNIFCKTCNGSPPNTKVLWHLSWVIILLYSAMMNYSGLTDQAKPVFLWTRLERKGVVCIRLLTICISFFMLSLCSSPCQLPHTYVYFLLPSGLNNFLQTIYTCYDHKFLQKLCHGGER